MMTSAPASARPRAMALPRPRLPPVTRATRPERSNNRPTDTLSATGSILRRPRRYLPLPPVRAVAHAPAKPFDLRHAGCTLLGRDLFLANWCGHGQEFITVPDTAGMW